MSLKETLILNMPAMKAIADLMDWVEEVLEEIVDKAREDAKADFLDPDLDMTILLACDHEQVEMIARELTYQVKDIAETEEEYEIFINGILEKVRHIRELSPGPKLASTPIHKMNGSCNPADFPEWGAATM